MNLRLEGLLPVVTITRNGLMSADFFRNYQFIMVPYNTTEKYFELTQNLGSSKNLALRIISSSSDKHQIIDAVFINSASFGLNGKVIFEGGNGDGVSLFIDANKTKICIRYSGSLYTTISVMASNEPKYQLGLQEYNGTVSDLVQVSQ